jgi:uncharacterized protein
VRGLQLVVSNDCNFKCKYCFVNNMYGSEERKWFQTDEQNRIMSLETACAAMDRTLEIVRRNGHSELFVEFFGGEPLTNWPLVRSVLERYPSAGATGPGVRYSITTNGSLVTEEMAEVLARHGVTVTVSFDSPKNTDRLPVSGGGARRLIQDAITRLRRHENWVTFNSVLSKQTIDTFDGRSLVDFAVEHGVKMIGLILDLDLAFYADPGNRAKAVAAIMDTYQYGVSRGLPIVGYWHQIFAQIVGLHSLNLQKGFKTCPAEGCKVSVEPAGHVFICKCCSGHLGHVDRLEDVFRTPAYRDYAMKAYLNDPSCAGCDLENFCSGVCMGALEKRYRSVFGRETSSCQVFRELLEALIHTVRNPNAS